MSKELYTYKPKSTRGWPAIAKSAMNIDEKSLLFEKYFLACVLSQHTKEPRVKEIRDQIKEHLKPINYATSMDKKNDYGHHLFRVKYSGSERALWQISRYVERCDPFYVCSIRHSDLKSFSLGLNKLGIQLDAHFYDGVIYDGRRDCKFDPSSLPIALFPFQAEDVKKLVTQKRAILGHEMGCGKTIMAIAIGTTIKDKKLVIAPKTLLLNWKQEVENMGRTAELYTGGEPTAEWSLINYEALGKVDYPFNAVFIDEAHKIKAVNDYGQPSSKRAKLSMKIGLAAEYCYAMTGTPILSSNIDLYNLLVLMKSNYISSFYEYKVRYHSFEPMQRRRGPAHFYNSNSKELHRILSTKMIRRLRKDVLPDLKKIRRFVPIESRLSLAYKKAEQDFLISSDVGSAASARMALSAVKAKKAIKLAEDLDEPVVFATHFTETAHTLKKHFGNKACMITGEVSYEDRQKAINDFQAGKKKYCILNIQAGGVGITLTKAKTMIMVDYSWVPADCIQVEDRICRIGQSETCEIFYLYEKNSKMDEAFVKLLTNKAKNNSIVTDNQLSEFTLTDVLNAV